MATVADVTARPASGIPWIDAVMDKGPGWNWLAPARNVIYYTFDLADPNANQASVVTGAITAFNPAQQAAANAVLAYVGRVTGIVFEQVASGFAADMHFSQGDIVGNFSGYTNWFWNYRTTGSTITSYTVDAYIYLDSGQYATSTVNPVSGNFGYELLLHEIGHAMGLKHSFDPSNNGITLPTDQDNTAHTLMSYTQVGSSHSTYSPDDIAALSWLYGGDGLGGTWGYNSSNGPSATLVPTVVNGTTTADTLAGGAGMQAFIAAQGNDNLDGGAGTDTAVFTGPSTRYVLTLSGNTTGASTVRDTNNGANSDGTDTLVNVERLQFSNQSVALDLAVDQAGGKALLAMAATLGAAFPLDKTWAGNFLRFFDGGASVLEGTSLLFAAGIVQAIAGASDNASIVKLVYTNVTGSAPSATLLAALVAPLNAGTLSPAQWMADMALSATNQTHVNLAGFAKTGWEFFA